MNKLEFVVGQRKVKPEQEYLDFTIDGKSLIDCLQLSYMDFVSPFGWGNNKEYEYQLLKEFRLESLSTLDSGRTMFYVCPECGDIGCGAITGYISKNTNGQIEWTDFGYENNYQGIVEKYTNFHFCFNEEDYLQTIQNLRDRI